MGKVRAKDVKRKLGADFKRKTAKVGKKVERSNVTKISVVSKRITLPLQAALAEANKDETANIDGLIRLMTHYSSKNRAAALSELQDIFERNTNARKYIGITLPHILELLFDGTAEVHRSMLDLLTSLLTNYDPNDFSSVVPVLVTYICSGLTSLNLAIRKDTLVVLNTITTLQPMLLSLFVDKIFEHLLTLIEGSLAESGTRDSYSAGTDEMGNASAQVTQKLANVEVVKRRKQESAAKQMVQRKVHDSNVLLLSLKIFVALLSNNGQTQSTSNSEATDETDSENGYLFAANKNVQLRTCRRVSLLLGPSDSTSFMDIQEETAMAMMAEAAANAVNPIKATLSNISTGIAAAGNGGTMSLNSPVLPKLCSVLRRIWNGYLPHEAAPLSNKLEVIMKSMADVLVVLSRIVGANALQAPPAIVKELRRTAHIFAVQFPYSVLETSCLSEGKKKKPKQARSEEALAVVALPPMEVEVEGRESEQEDMDGIDEASDAEQSDDDEVISLMSSKTSAYQAAAVDESILADARKRFKILNITVAEIVINLYSETMCLEYFSLAPKMRVDTQAYFRSYGLIQQFIRSELSKVLPLLDNLSPSVGQDCDLTPKEYYQKMLTCHQLSYMQLNKILSLNMSPTELNTVHPGIVVDSTFNLPKCLSTLLESFLRLGMSFRCKGYVPFVEACVESLCGVAEEAVAHQSFEMEAVSGTQATAVVADVISGLASAMSLMGALANEPGQLTSMLVDSSVRFMALVSCEESDNIPANVSVALVKFQAAALNLFHQPAEDSEEAEEALYSRAPLSTRLRMLDLWVNVAPVSGFMRGAENVFECIKANIYEADWKQGAESSSEIGYFLRLFHMRRHHASLSEFKDFVYSSIEAVGSAYQDIIGEVVSSFIESGGIYRATVSLLHDQLHRIIDSCTRSILEIIMAVVKCSNPQHPEKLLSMLADPTLDMVAALEDGRRPVDVSSSVTAALFTAAMHASTLKTVLHAQLTTCLRGDDSTVVDQSFIDMTARAMFLSVLLMQKAESTGSVTTLDVFSQGPSVPIPLSATALFFSDTLGCMALMTRAVPQINTTTGVFEHSFAIFNSFVGEIVSEWGSLNSDSKVSLFKVVKEFYRRSEFDSSMPSTRKVIEALLDNLNDTESNGDILALANELKRFVAI